VAAWFEPRMNAASGGVQSWKCGGVDEAVAAAQRMVHAEAAARSGGDGVPAAPGRASQVLLAASSNALGDLVSRVQWQPMRWRVISARP
jgi:hypothetical protein